MSGLRNKILYASLSYTTHDRRFISAAIEHGWEVSFLRFDGGAGGFENRILPEGARPINWLGTRLKLTDELRPQFIEAMHKVVREELPQIVHAGPLTSVAPIAVAASFESPIVCTSWASDLLYEVPRSKEALTLASKAIEGASYLIVDCETVKKSALALGSPLGTLSAFPWGIEIGDFPFRSRGRSDGVCRIVSLRSFEGVYDVETLVEAAVILKNNGFEFQLVLVGAGSLECDLREKVDEWSLSDQVDFVGRISEDEIADVLSASDLYVSTSRCDGSSVSLLQAMAVGIPVLVTDIESNREWVDPGVTGFVFAPGNAENLAEQIMYAASRRDLTKLVQNARKRIEQNADWEKGKQKLAMIYQEVLDRFVH